MIDSNQSRFHLVLGRKDWGAFTSPDPGSGSDPADWPTLSRQWDRPNPPEGIAWSDDSQAVILSPRSLGFPPPPFDANPSLEDRRGSAIDRFGNIYHISSADGEPRIWITNSGDNSRSIFWPLPVAPRPVVPGTFVPVQDPPHSSPDLCGLAILPGHWLVAGCRGGQGSLLLFDLVGGADPLFVPFRTGQPIAPWDLSPLPDGGLAILDRTGRRIWVLDATLGGDLSQPYPSDRYFTPSESGAVDPRDPARESRGMAPPIPLPTDSVPISLEALPDGSFVVLSRPEGSEWGELVHVPRNGASERWNLDVYEELVVFPESPVRTPFRLKGFDIAVRSIREVTEADRASAEAVDKDDTHVVDLVIASEDGNQVFEAKLHLRPSGWRPIAAASESLMRRYSGASLLSAPEGVRCLTGSRWVPLVTVRRRRYIDSGILASPVLDGGAPGFAWHRLAMDGRIPPGAKVLVRTRTSDHKDGLGFQPFSDQPAPVYRRSGSEIPWTDQFLDPAGGSGTWELLLQAATGRFLQIVLELSGQELQTPVLHAVRVWKPRFSYVDHYLPATYRQDEGSRDFLERFLANFEGSFTGIEDRIVAATALFDVRTAPDSSLDWLADWLGLALDPAMDERRRRLLLRHAPLLYSFRGTSQGILLALRIATSECLDDSDFALPQTRAESETYGIRMVELFLTRKRSAALTGQTQIDLSNAETLLGSWSVDQGSAQLQVRWTSWLASVALDPTQAQGATDLAREMPVFRPIPPAVGADIWGGFCQLVLGAVPTLAQAVRSAWIAIQGVETILPDLPRDESRYPQEQWMWGAALASLPVDAARSLGRWQDSLRRRWGNVSRLNEEWGTSWPDFARIAPLDRVPAGGGALEDWSRFETFLEPVRSLAHRFRVLVPTTGPLDDRTDFDRIVDHARRVIELEKPAHASFDVQPYWALFRVGQARLAIDTSLGLGNRSDSLAPWLRTGSSQIGATRIWRGELPPDRIGISNIAYRTSGG